MVKGEYINENVKYLNHAQPKTYFVHTYLNCAVKKASKYRSQL